MIGLSVVVVVVATLLIGAALARSNHRAASPAGDTSAGQAALSGGAEAPVPEAGSDASRPAVTVTVAEAVVRPIQRTVQFVGNFVGYDEVTVMAEVTGRVVEVCHDVGDVVRPGDVLLKIDPTDYALAVQETRRALELEAARMGLPTPRRDEDFTPEKILPILDAFDLSKLPSVLRARQEEENARRKADRAQKLRDQNIISQEVYDQVMTDYEVARNALAQAEHDARALAAGIRHRLVLLQIAEEKLRRTNVVVPAPTRREGMPEVVEYVVAERKITEGEMLKDSPGASTAVFELVLDKVLKLEATAPEQFIGDVKVGQDVEVRDVEAYPGRTFKGKVWRVSPVVDREKHSFEFEALLPNPQRELKPGGYAKGAILTRVDEHALVVPVASLVTFVGSTKVFVVRDGKALAVPVTPGVEFVTTGQNREAWVEIINPDPLQLRPGTQVVTSGQNKLVDGSPVTIRKVEGARGKAESGERKAD